MVATPILEATKQDSLLIDADNNGAASPGDTLQYSVIVRNDGNAEATGVLVADDLDPNTTLVAGSVQTSLGGVTEGNTAGDDDVRVSIGSLPGGGRATVTYRVVVNSPLPAGVMQVSNQAAILTATNAAGTVTDEPQTPENNDATTTTVVAAPMLNAIKRAALFTDADNNGVPSPGDTLLYTIVARNEGTIGATVVVGDDTLDANTTLAVGSVRTSQGTVTRGNATGDTNVSIAVGTLAGNNGTVTISFAARINTPLGAGVTQVSNQATVSAANVGTVLTDDPDTAEVDDATIVSVAAQPVLRATKQDALTVDADNNDAPSPGDTVQYTVVVRNDGNIAATGVIFDDTPDGNSTLVVGSVQTTGGAVVSGNSAGNGSVRVNIGTLAGGAQTTITFQVRVNTPLDAGVVAHRQPGRRHGDQRGGHCHRRSLDAGTQRRDLVQHPGNAVARSHQA